MNRAPARPSASDQNQIKPSSALNPMIGTIRGFFVGMKNDRVRFDAGSFLTLSNMASPDHASPAGKRAGLDLCWPAAPWPLSRLVGHSGPKVVLWLAGPVGPEEIPSLVWDSLVEEEKARANRFFQAEDRRLFAFTRATLRHLLSRTTKIPAKDICFSEGPNGKPRLSSGAGPCFNVSHSGAYALIGLSDERPIGVDIEWMRGFADQMDVARSFFSTAEYQALTQLGTAMRHEAFYKIWTCKEAVLKALGVGIIAHLKEFSVEWNKAPHRLLWDRNCSLPGLALIEAFPLEVTEGYAGCYALA